MSNLASAFSETIFTVNNGGFCFRDFCCIWVLFLTGTCSRLCCILMCMCGASYCFRLQRARKETTDKEVIYQTSSRFQIIWNRLHGDACCSFMRAYYAMYRKPNIYYERVYQVWPVVLGVLLIICCWSSVENANVMWGCIGLFLYHDNSARCLYDMISCSYRMKFRAWP